MTRWHVAHSQFGERLSYAVFLYHLQHGEPPGWAELGREVGRSGPAVAAWLDRETAPPDYAGGKPLHAPLTQFFAETGVEKSWLIDGAGEPPRPELWREWIAKRRATAAGLRLHDATKEAASAGRGRTGRTKEK